MLVLSLVLSAHSAELHVEAGESIQAVLNEAEPGDRIVIAAGTYDEDLSTESSGEEDAPITVAAAEPGAVIITHSGGTVIEADATMPSHGGHGMNVYPELDDDGAGTVVANPFQFHMPGYWELFVQLENAEGQVETVRFDMACCD